MKKRYTIDLNKIKRGQYHRYNMGFNKDLFVTFHSDKLELKMEIRDQLLQKQYVSSEVMFDVFDLFSEFEVDLTDDISIRIIK